jgi:hypothetical protein
MHACVVTCGSEYFRAMLEHAMVESGSRSFELHEVQPRVLQRVVEWLYSGELGEISDVIEGLALLEGSRFLGAARMEAQCIAWLCAHVEASNCVAVWAEANRLGCGAVAVHAIGVVGRRLASLAAEAEFLGLPLEALLELVRSDELAVRSERVVYEAVISWVLHDEASRKAWLGEMLGAVRLALLPASYLAGTVSAEPLVMGSCEALRILAEARRCNQLRGTERFAAESIGALRKRKHASDGQIVVVGGKDDSGSTLKSAECYDRSVERWQLLPEMSVARSECAAVCLQGNVFVLGGYDGDSSAYGYVGGSTLRTAECYERSSSEWRPLPDMSIARQGCAAVCVAANLYVVGGSDRRSRLRSAEMYDGSTGQWRPLPDMHEARYGCAAVCLDGNVFVVGGYDGDSYLKSAEMFDGLTGLWQPLPDMHEARYGCAAVCIERNVYVVGGYDGCCELRSGEMYDGSSGRWVALPNMSEARKGCAAVCIEGTVCVMGGIDFTTKHASVECYDPVAREWRTLPSMGRARWLCGAASTG